jgi:hypothetical protein
MHDKVIARLGLLLALWPISTVSQQIHNLSVGEFFDFERHVPVVREIHFSFDELCVEQPI